MDLQAQLLASLQSQNLPLPSTRWLTALATSRTPPPPLASLVATARARLLAADLTAASLLDGGWVAAHSLPADTAAATTREARLPRDVVVQVLDVEDVARSRWEQVEELEAVERGELTRGRQVIRLPAAGGEGEDGDDGDDDGGGGGGAQGAGGTAAGGAGRKNATHRLVLQDAKGQRVYGLELRRVHAIGVGTTNIGEKMLLRSGSVVARGVVMLEPSNCVTLGGKVDAWQKSWLEGRLARLRGAALATRQD